MKSLTFGDGYDVNQSRNSGLVFSDEKSSQIFSNVCIQLHHKIYFDAVKNSMMYLPNG